MLQHVTINAQLLSAQAGYRSAGIHGYIYHSLAALPEADPGFRYTLLTGDAEVPPHPRLVTQRTGWVRGSPLRRIAWEQLWQPATLAGLSPDLYHAMAFVAPPYVPCPFVVTVYDLSFIRFPAALSRARRAYLQLFTRQSCQRAAQVITISESTAQDVMHFFDIPPEKITVAVPGVDARFMPLNADQVAAFRQQMGLPERFLLHLGTLEPRKNLAMVLRAYAGLPAELRRAVHFVLAGGKGWDYEDVFETVRRYGLQDTVHFPGYVDAADLPLWYNAAQALVYPSLFEGWGLPVVEAMACACPTLVSDVSSLPEAAGTTGMRLPPDDVSAWTAALHTAITDSTWRMESAAAGLERSAHFRWQQTAAATIAAYKKVLGN